MISVRTIFERVRDLSRKDKAGYMSADEFNRDLAEAQTLLMDYHYQLFEKGEKGLDALSPFIKETYLVITDQFCDFPADYRHKLEAGYVYTKNICCVDGCMVAKKPEVDIKDMQHLKTGEVLKTISSAIRKPKINLATGEGKFAYTFVNNKVKVFPKELLGYLYFKYVTDPPLAFYSTTIDVNTQEEVYNPTTSINLAWNEQEQPDLVKLMLYFKGIEVRESALIQWVNQSEQFQKRG